MKDIDKISDLAMIKDNIATSEEIWREGYDYILKVLAETEKYAITVKTPEEMFGAIKWVCTHHQYLKVNGMLLDVSTACAIWQVLNAMTEERKRKLLSFSLEKVVNFTWKCFK